MKLYCFFLIMSIVGISVCSQYPRYVKVNGQYEPRARFWQAGVLFGVVIFFCGLRSGIADTPAYISEFESAVSNISQLDIDAIQKDKGYAILEVLFKQFISDDYHWWLLLIAAVSGIAIMYTLYKYSIDFGMSFFLFIASTQFTWLINGMRQFTAVCLIFAAITLMLEKKWWQYIFVVLLVSTFHGTAIIMIPIYFIGQWKPFSLQSIVASAAIAVAGINIGRFDFLFDNTQYEGHLDTILETSGMNMIRFLVAAVPVVIAVAGRKIIKAENNRLINICVNMSCFYIAVQFSALFAGANYIGRIATYFNVYNLILLPWMIKNCFTKDSERLVKLACVICYCIYFYYQIVITWKLGYISDILGLNF